MAWYYCFIRGDNFPGEIFGEAEPYDFYTHRYVKADNAEKAERIALAELRKDDSFKLPDNLTPSVHPKVYFEEVSELEKEPEKTTMRGATWFKMSDADQETE